MGEKRDFFEPYYLKDNSTAGARFLRYPPRKKDEMGCGQHTDFGVMTLLLQDHVGGLQILINDKWVDAPPLKDTLVVNMGDCIELLTNGKLKATTHRVINKSTTEERFVALVFHDPDWAFPIDCLSKFKEDPDPFTNRLATFGDHFKSKYYFVYPN